MSNSLKLRIKKVKKHNFKYEIMFKRKSTNDSLNQDIENFLLNSTSGLWKINKFHRTRFMKLSGVYPEDKIYKVYLNDSMDLAIMKLTFSDDIWNIYEYRINS